MKKKIARLTVFLLAIAVCLPSIGINAASLYDYKGWSISAGLATKDFTTSRTTVYTKTKFSRTSVKPGYPKVGFSIALRKRSWLGGYPAVDTMNFPATTASWAGTVTFKSSGTGVHDLYFYSSNHNYWSCSGNVYE